ncbi:MAG: DNA double-strand break repair nuclease NurA [Armatimonadetes bacterium]|nr:DNA double-strand break repair nuclease NurA [Anaerolineae bacterium]
MSLEFTKLMMQVQKLGAMLNALDFDLRDQLQIALERFGAAGDLDAVRERIEVVRGADVSGYRGAAPLDAPYGQPVNLIYPAPDPIANATVLAADGSQIYPDEQSPVHYYLLNIGLFTYRHGMAHTPEQLSVPQLMYHKQHVHDKGGRVISNRTVDARRTLSEMEHLAQHSWTLHRAGAAQPVVALYDNHLLFWANSDVVNGDQILRDYLGAMTQLHDSGAVLAGYVDNPFRSRVMMRLLYLLSLKDAAEIKAKQNYLAQGGDLEGLRDIHLFDAILEPGERSAIMVQNSPRNLSYKRRGASYEIAFFYIKVANAFQSAIARVDIPVWVARDARAVDALHSLLLAQCTMQGRTPYPYALTRADELALVTGKDKAKLDELVRIEMRKKDIAPQVGSAKDQSKNVARSDKRIYKLRTDIREVLL